MFDKNIDIGKKIKEIRESLQMSQKALAEALGEKPYNLSKIESNTYNADIYVIYNICKIANITVEDFLDKETAKTIIITPEIRELIGKAKILKPEQIKKLSVFIDSLIIL